MQMRCLGLHRSRAGLARSAAKALLWPRHLHHKSDGLKTAVRAFFVFSRIFHETVYTKPAFRCNPTRILVSFMAQAKTVAYAQPVHFLRPKAPASIILVADHAARAIPPELGVLGLPPETFARHIAYDIGVAELAEALSAKLDAPAVLAGFSRLVIDPNRGVDDPTLVMRLSDGDIIPGNAKVDEAEVSRRTATYYQPYHQAIDAALDGVVASGRTPFLVSLHSFTPNWRGFKRPWHCAVLWAGDAPTGLACIAALRAEAGLVVGDNEPYTGALEGDCMDQHGTKRGVPHVLLETRQDLIATEAGVAEWAERYAKVIDGVVMRSSGKAC